MLTLYFAPLACSLAVRIALYEAGVPAHFEHVDRHSKRLLADGSDYFAINPMGQVPLLRLEDGTQLTENGAILRYLADRHPGLGPTDAVGRAQLQQWLSFVSTELHKIVFAPLVDPKSSAEVKTYARGQANVRMAALTRHLGGREFLLDEFSVADGLLATVLNWAAHFGVDLAQWPEVQAYFKRIVKRPTIARAMAEEYALYQAELAQLKQA